MNTPLLNRRTLLQRGMLAGSAGLAGMASYNRAAAQEPMIDRREFGIIGDGVTDDTHALRKAMAAGQGAVRLPRGVYKISRTLEIELDRIGPFALYGDGVATLHMHGPGPAIRLTGTHEGTAGPTTVKENVWQRQRTPVIDGLEIVGMHEDAEGIEAAGTMQAIFARLVIRRAKHGIHLPKRNRNVIISDCHIYENRGIGVYLDHVNLHQINICNSHISYNGGGGVVLRGGAVRNLQVGTCDIEGNMDPNGPPTANVLFDTTGGTLNEAAVVGCTIQHNHTSRDSANVRILGAGGKERGQAPGNITIADNVISDVMVNIHLQDARGVMVVGNTIWKGFQHNVLIERSTHINIGPNMLDRNPAYKPGDSQNNVIVEDSADCLLSGLDLNNTLKTPAALTIRRCNRMNVTGCSILDCEGTGMLLEELKNSRISDCLIRNDNPERAAGQALIMRGGSGNMVVNNLLAGGFDIAEGTAYTANNHNSI